MVLAPWAPLPELIRDRQADHQLCACSYVAAAGCGQLQSPHPDGLVRGVQVVCEAPFMPQRLTHGHPWCFEAGLSGHGPKDVHRVAATR